MCLDKITRGLSESELSGTGWKVFLKYRYHPITFQYSNLYGTTSRLGGWEVPLNKWLKAVNIQISFKSVYYTSGFHIFRTRAAARSWKSSGPYHGCIRKVQYRDGRILGQQHGLDVIVADRMFVFPGTKG